MAEGETSNIFQARSRTEDISSVLMTPDGRASEPPRMRGHLLIDADDTLWENNIYFERAFEAFVDFLAHSSLRRQQIRAVLDGIELANRRERGYGASCFTQNLRDCYAKLAERPLTEEASQVVVELARRIVDQPIEVIAGVPETLVYLTARHELTLFTKGDPEEQRSKIERSGLRRFFARCAIVPEKDVTAYRGFLADHRVAPARCWMIGNSPKSDVNPALEAGLNAVLIPHPHTRGLETEELQAVPGRFLQVECFSELRHHF